MHNITLISTIHNETGKCNSDELHKIIETICPGVIFLEAFESCYTGYDHSQFSQFGTYHKRLEIKAIQKYSLNHSFEYIPVLDNGLPDAFERKNKIVCENREYQKLLDDCVSLESERGFQFLNSEECLQLQKEMREFEKLILNNNELYQKVDQEIDAYENAMIRNIYAYSKDNSFSTAIFMCGVAHRKSIIDKIERHEIQEGVKLNWTFYGNCYNNRNGMTC